MSTGTLFMPRTSLEDDRYACSYCSQRYPSERDLDIHEYMHGNYDKEAIFDLAVQPRISYLTYEYFTFECRGMESGVFGKETGCAVTPEQDYEDEKSMSFTGNCELFSTSESSIHIHQPTGQPSNKLGSQPLMTHTTPTNRQPSPSYMSPIHPPLNASYTPIQPPLSPSYTPIQPPLSPSYTPIQSPLIPSYTSIQSPLSLNYTPPDQPPISPSYTPPDQPPLSPSYTPPVQPPLSPSYTPPVQPPLSPSYTPPVQPPLSPSYTPPVQTFGRSCTPTIQTLGSSYMLTNPAGDKFGLLPFPDQHNERPSMKFFKIRTPSEKIEVTTNTDFTKCQTSFPWPTDHDNNSKTFCNDINRFTPSCRIEQGFKFGSGSKGNSPWIS